MVTINSTLNKTPLSKMILKGVFTCNFLQNALVKKYLKD